MGKQLIDSNNNEAIILVQSLDSSDGELSTYTVTSENLSESERPDLSILYPRI